MARVTPIIAALVALAPISCVRAQAVSQAEAATSPNQPYISLGALRAKYRDPAGKIAVIKGTEIYYKDEGRGPVLLMVHGSASSLRTWDGIVAKLKSRYRIIRYDVGGMGLSGDATDEVAAHVTPTDIAFGLLDTLGVDKFSVVGVSSGGTLGSYMAALRPDRVERLILSATPSDRVTYGHMVEPDSFKREQDIAKQSGGYRSQRFWNEFMDYFWADRSRISAKQREAYYDVNRRTPEKHPFALVALIGDGVKSSEQMAKITAPTLLVWGAKDPLLVPAALKALENHLSNAQVSKIVMPDVGHYPPLEVPERFAAIVAAYLEDVAPRN